MRLYDTYDKKIKEFKPIGDVVKIYVCGMTPQDRPHIGHMRTFVMADVLRRLLELQWPVLAISNFTDIDDKIIAKANQLGVSWRDVADKNIDEFLKAHAMYFNKPFAFYPRVTEHIDDVIKFVAKLIEKGYAYESNGSVYFDVDKFADYGKLSNAPKGEWKQELEFLQEKRNPYDFALWKRKKPGEPAWQSPWGEGRPGWHIECSAMSIKYLGEQFDIHAGGTDLIFPHHENEIAQSEAYTGKRWVNFWFHVGIVNIKGEKMSKSLGNIIPATDFAEEYGAGVARLFLLHRHYRAPLNVDEEDIEAIRKLYNRIKSAILTAQQKADDAFKADAQERKFIDAILKAEVDFFNALNDDLNTSIALAKMDEVASVANKSDSSVVARMAYETLKRMNAVLGVWDDLFVAKREVDVMPYIRLLVDIRSKLRAAKQFELADEIRARLAELGVLLDDSGKETRWRIIK